jgi:V8-like Glu-specific endopeptidase
MPLGYRALLAISSTGLALVVAVPAPAAHAETSVAASGSVRSPVTSTAVAQSAAAYWTKERMLSAAPVPAAEIDVGEVEKPKPRPGPQGPAGKVDPVRPDGAAVAAKALADPGATAATWAGPATSPPATTSGKVFFTGADGLPYVCSGSTVNSAGKDVVFTAGHCVGRFGVWFNAQPWIFVPGYNNGNAPYGQWTAWQLWTRTAWLNNDNRAEDMGAAVMNTNASGWHIVDWVGGQGIEWNYPLAQYQFQFGYPQRTPFNGQLLKYCTGNSYNDGGHNGINCNMTEGASGGPWLDDFDGTFGWLDGVNSWVFWNAAGVRYKWNSPYFGNNAADLYNNVANL